MSSSPSSSLEALRDGIDGEVLLPADGRFDEARAVWNARFDRSPVAIARCAGPGDVSTAIRYARAEGLSVSVKGGGHSYAGNTVVQGSLLIDLSAMDGVSVDAAARRAAVGGGARWGQVDAATQRHGLATVGGTVSTVGVGGFILGGGSGWLTRRHGLALDNVLAAEIVTADGRVVGVGPDENPDLFWAIRGGSGNFGVVTRFDLRLHPVGPQVIAGQVFYPLERATELLQLYRDVFADAPEDLVCYPFFLRVPPLDVFPADRHGEVVLDMVLAWVGDVDAGMPHLQPFRDAGGAFLEFVGPTPYVALQQSFDAGMQKGNRWYSRAHQFDALTDEAIDALVHGLGSFPGDFTMVYLGPLGGAGNRVARDATAYAHRTTEHELHVFPGWTDAGLDRDIMSWADGVHEVMEPHANGRVYVNLLGDGEDDRRPQAWGENWSRLRRIKKEWDPDNVFAGNHNIPPAD